MSETNDTLTLTRFADKKGYTFTFNKKGTALTVPYSFMCFIPESCFFFTHASE